MRAILAIVIALLGSVDPGSGQALKQQSPVDTRVFSIATMLRCPVCQSETILDSQSSSAKEMLLLVREMVDAGRSDNDIIAFFHGRYGDYVLMEPPARGVNRVLWLLPLLNLLLGGISLVIWLRRQQRDVAVPDRSHVRYAEEDLEQLKL